MTTATATSPTTSKGWHIGLWVAQAVLGVMFIGAGLMKATQPIAEMGKQMAWALYTPEALVRFIGVSEFLGGVGLILPSALRILPKLTVAAAAGLAIVMVLAAGTHLTHSEANAVPINVVLGGIAVFIAYGRAVKAPIAAR